MEMVILYMDQTPFRSLNYVKTQTLSCLILDEMLKCMLDVCIFHSEKYSISCNTFHFYLFLLFFHLGAHLGIGNSHRKIKDCKVSCGRLLYFTILRYSDKMKKIIPSHFQVRKYKSKNTIAAFLVQVLLEMLICYIDNVVDHQRSISNSRRSLQSLSNFSSTAVIWKSNIFGSPTGTLCSN